MSSTRSAGLSTTGPGGGSFIYHWGENLASVGFVVHLNYENPYISPFDELQRFKTHPSIAPMFEGGKRIGLRRAGDHRRRLAVVPDLTFPGGALIGCSAGLRERAADQGLA